MGQVCLDVLPVTIVIHLKRRRRERASSPQLVHELLSEVLGIMSSPSLVGLEYSIPVSSSSLVGTPQERSLSAGCRFESLIEN